MYQPFPHIADLEPEDMEDFTSEFPAATEWLRTKSLQRELDKLRRWEADGFKGGTDAGLRKRRLAELEKLSAAPYSTIQ